MSKIHLSFKESDNYSTKGWTSFYTYYPEQMTSIGNKFFTAKYGQLWLHNDIENPIMNNIYGEQLKSSITFNVTHPQNTNMYYRAVRIEGNSAWDLNIETNLSMGEIKQHEFNLIESYYYTHFRKSELENDLHGLKTKGIGVATSTIGDNTFVFSHVPYNVNVNDDLYIYNNQTYRKIGVITNIQDNILHIVRTDNNEEVNGVFFAVANTRIAGAEIRGYYSKVSLFNKETKPIELYAVSFETSKSYI